MCGCVLDNQTMCMRASVISDHFIPHYRRTIQNHSHMMTLDAPALQEATMHMTGQMRPEQRRAHWQERRIFFVTGQVMLQDIVEWGESRTLSPSW